MKIGEQLEIAENLDTKPDLLAEIAKSDKAMVRRKVAKHPNCSIATQINLGQDEDEQVRIELSQNVNIRRLNGFSFV
jgi:hypothetical protein